MEKWIILNDRLLLCNMLVFVLLVFLFSQLVYENELSQSTDSIREKILDLLEQSFPNPMFVNDLAK